MHGTDLPVFYGKQWLVHLIDRAASVGACVRWGCTTCGAVAFRQSLLASAKSAVAGNDERAILFEVARQIRSVPGTADQIAAMRFVIMLLHARAGDEMFEQQLLPFFTRAPAVREYRAMKAHHETVMARRREHELRNSPDEIRRRKTLRKKIKDEKLAIRATRKLEIDRAWRNRAGKLKLNPGNQ